MAMWRKRASLSGAAGGLCTMPVTSVRFAAVLPELLQTALTFSKFATRKPCQGYFALSPCN
jgi:hypothetical protein